MPRTRAANLNPERIYPSLFEPVHGSAPDIIGKGVANPAAAILPNGSTLLFYKSIAVGYPARNRVLPPPVFHIGGAITHGSPHGPYVRLSEGPLLQIDGKTLAAEDPYAHLHVHSPCPWPCP